MAWSTSSSHTEGMDYVSTKILAMGLPAMVSLPAVIATFVLILSVCTGCAARVAVLIEDLRSSKRTQL